MRKIIIIAAVCALVMGIFFVKNRLKNNILDGPGMERTSFAVREDISADEFKEFYYTYSSTTNPPEFQRYRFYSENGKYMFYHEKREGENVFLTEDDITVHGTKELTQDEWDSFWDFMCKGSIQKRSEDESEGGSGPWLYLYLNGELEEYQEFHFNDDPGILLSFEEFCRNLKSEALKISGQALSDEGLTLLVNTCKKRIATVGGDGYTEIVLYLDEKTGQYWLHTYSKYDYMPEEEHASYTASPELAESVLKYIDEKDLASWKDFKGVPLCGADYIIRFKHGDVTIRLDSGKMPDNLEAYSKISSMLYAGVTDENRRYRE